MTSLLLIVSTFLLVGILACLLAFVLKFRSLQDDFFRYVTPQDANTPSRLAKLVDTVGNALGYSVAMQLKTFLMGKASGQSRADIAAHGDILEGQSPGLADLAKLAGIGKGKTRNSLLDIGLQLLAKQVGREIPSPGEDHSNYASELKKYS